MSRTPAKTQGKPERLRFDNPFEATHGDAAEAADLQYRAELMIALRDFFAFKALSQSQICEILGVPQPRVSELLTGKIRALSSATLHTYLARIGFRPEVSFVREPKEGKPRIEAHMVEFA